MTCIVAYKKDGIVCIGGDSAGVSGLDIHGRKDSKVFQVQKFIIGYTSSFRMGQILRFKLKVSKQSEKESDYQYMCTKFIDSVRDVLAENGFTRKDDNADRIGTFLVVYKSNIYIICDDLQVGEHLEDYNAVGCGSKYALGALSILSKQELTVEQVVIEALEVAVKFSGGVRPPFNIIHE